MHKDNQSPSGFSQQPEIIVRDPKNSAYLRKNSVTLRDCKFRSQDFRKNPPVPGAPTFRMLAPFRRPRGLYNKRVFPLKVRSNIKFIFGQGKKNSRKKMLV